MPNVDDRFIKFDKTKYLKYIRDLGQGGTGETILCKDETVDMLFAIKKYAPSPQNNISENYKRFVDEIKILHNLNHPNIVRVYMSYLYPNYRTGYIQMEYVNGQPIDQFIATDDTNWEKLFLEAVDAFKYMHQNQILHRDIRPSNILVDTNGMIKIIDFGFGKKLEPNESAGHSILLNWPVTDPKEVTDERKYTYQTEIYYLGKLFSNLLSKDLSKQFKYSHIIVKMTQIDPSVRYQSFQEVISDISEDVLISQSFSADEKGVYQKMATALSQIIANFHVTPTLERNTYNILNKLEEIIKASSLETYIQNNSLLIQCFIIGGGFRYSNRQYVQVLSVENFYSFFRGLSERKRQIVLDNFNVRLSQIKIEAPDYDDMPF